MAVYVSQQPVPNKHQWVPDLSSATQYGPLNFVFSGGEQPYMYPQRSLDHAADTLRNFDPDIDFLLCPNVGDPASIWVCILALTIRQINRVKFLYWMKPHRGQPGYYSPIEFSLKELQDGHQRNSQAS